MIACPCSEHPITLHFYIVKLGFTGVYIIFLFLLQNIDCGYSLEPPQRVATISVWSKTMKNIKIFQLKIAIFTGVKIYSLLHRHVFVMITPIGRKGDKGLEACRVWENGM